ncbi:response regulator [Aliiglaciecola litoralis]|uniref:Response regulatory domain-containing protein n=1 Tax=Aliiglaciecola litoralis TaxID=582857 RepID=A0ABP3X2K7_9ALTE
MKKLDKINILLVDDSELNNEALKELLELHGATVDTALNGQQLVDTLLAKTKEFDIVLTDVDMPVLTGIQATEIIRENDDFESLPIVAITGNAKPENQWACFKAGMNGHIAKPIDLHKLCELILTLLSSKELGNVHESIPAQPNNGKGLKQQILERFDNNVELIERLLALYEEEFDKQLKCLKKAKDLQSTRSILHAIKGISATMGMVDVLAQVNSIAASELHNELPRSKMVEKIQTLSKVNAENVSLLKSMLKLSDYNAMSSKLVLDDSVLTQDECKEIKLMLKQNDLSVISYIKKIRNQRPDNAFIEQLFLYADQLRFKKALSLIDPE